MGNCCCPVLCEDAEREEVVNLYSDPRQVAESPPVEAEEKPEDRDSSSEEPCTTASSLASSPAKSPETEQQRSSCLEDMMVHLQKAESASADLKKWASICEKGLEASVEELTKALDEVSKAQKALTLASLAVAETSKQLEAEEASTSQEIKSRLAAMLQEATEALKGKKLWEERRTELEVMQTLQVRQISELGRGAFGRVLEVCSVCSSGVSGVSSALKITVDNPLELEAEVLKELSLRSLEGVPRYFGHGTGYIWMSVEKGMDLAKWLYKKRWGTFTSAASFSLASVLLEQMLPVLETLEKIAFHRDISAKNFLIDESSAGFKFKLLDFGLAVDARNWQSGGWKVEGVGGNPLYFPPGSWLAMAGALSHAPAAIQDQYACRLDHYAFGILLSEVVFITWMGSKESDAEKCDSPLRKTFEAYTEFHRFWQNCHSAMAKGKAIVTHLAADPKRCLESMRHALLRLLSSLNATDAPLLKVSAKLIAEDSIISWQELRQEGRSPGERTEISRCSTVAMPSSPCPSAASSSCSNPQ